MKNRLKKIRVPNRTYSISQRIAISVGVATFGFILGVIQKWLDALPSNALPSLLQQVDITNYFGRLAIWILLATILSIYASTPLRASLNTFMFLISMVAGYYIYCNYVLGFMPRSYMFIWIGMAIVSTVLAFICWYAKGEGVIAVIISAGILGVLFSQAVLITQGIYITHLLEVITWIGGVVLLRRKSKEFALEMGLSIVIAFVYQLVVPYYG